MVGVRNIASLLLALALAPSVIGTPVFARQDSGLSDLLGGAPGEVSSTDSDSDSVSTSSPSSDLPTTSTIDSATTTPQTTSAQPVTTSAAAPTPSSTQAVSTPTSVVNNSPSQTTAAPPKTTTSQKPKATIVNSAGSQQVVYETVFTTNGQTITTSFADAVPTADAGANGNTNSNNNGPQGLDPQTARIVGGVVGGVGGAILIAGIAAVIYRVWGKNRSRGEEDDVLMGDGVYGTSELKGASGNTTPSPFTNNLEQYHNPGKTNPSANF